MILGIIRLAPGRAAFYDDLTNIHLTPMKPEANVYQGMNTSKLKRGVAYGTIRLVSGTLELTETQPASPYYMPQIPQEPVMTPAPEMVLDSEPKLVPIEDEDLQAKESKTKTKSKKEK